jgi:hypothetical protein
MYNSLVILLHRPFASDGHLQSASLSAASDAFNLCTTAALEIHKTLQLYQEHFRMMSAPYFISYATYVSATIHVRIAAQRQPDSEAHKCLQNCLDALTKLGIRCRAPAKTRRILQGLMNRLKLDVNSASTGPLQVQEGETPGDLANVTQVDPMNRNSEIDLDYAFTGIDMDEILKTFTLEPVVPALSSDTAFMPTPVTLPTGDVDMVRTAPDYDDSTLMFPRTRTFYSVWILCLD